MSELSARKAVERLIARIPNLLTAAVLEKFTDRPLAVVHTQDEVAARIGAVLADGLKSEGYELVELPPVSADGYGGLCVRIALSSQPWADAEIRITRGRRGDNLIVSGLPNPLAVEDVPIVAAGLLAIYGTRPRITRDRG
ncbi:hypothetical protein [Mycobacteroides abscessus]|uniref:hypothetical protein n=1 Tax=Mycobacteroides abscessus TaxID=36809 RepID=UPI0005E95D33|nr:hypothetical protein [Mycobacteroides abscessus]CPR72483.1 Hypothetical protein ERS075494_01057 [Mycobacteroides abscessus]CPV06635.1 Hypothetical protein ERS075562_04854 [Mycobacteroides abscessus]